MPQSYSEILERWDRSRAFGDTRDLKSFSGDLAQLQPGQGWEEGLRDGPWTRFSTRLDQSLQGKGPYGNELTSAPSAVLGGVVGGVGEMFGQGEAGRVVGAGLPRMAVDMAPLIAAGPVGWAGALGAVGTGALMGAHTYADTGSRNAALATGVTGALMPVAGRVAGSVAARMAGAPLVEGMTTAGQKFSQYFAETGGQKAAQFVGSQTGMNAMGVAGMVGADRAMGGNTSIADLVMSPEFLIQQIPFTVFDAVHMAKAPKVTAKEMQGRLLPMSKREAKVEIPHVPSEGTAEAQAQTEQLMERLRAAQALPDDAPGAVELKAQAFKSVLDSVVGGGEKVEVPAGVKTQPAVGPLRIRGYMDGNRVAVDSVTGAPTRLPDHKTIFVDEAQVTNKVTHPDGTVEFDVPAGNVKPAKYELKRPFVDPNAQELRQFSEFELAEQRRSQGVKEREEFLQRDAGQAMGLNPEAGLNDRGVGYGDVTKDFGPVQRQQISPPETQVMVQDMKIAPERVMRLVNTEAKSENPMLDFFQGPVQRDAAGNVARIGLTDVAVDGWMNRVRFEKASGLPKEFVQALPPEVFQGDRINATEAVKALEGMVKVRRLDVNTGEKTTVSQQERAQAQHELETLGWIQQEGGAWKAPDGRILTFEDNYILDQQGGEVPLNTLPLALQRLQADYSSDIGTHPDASESATARFSQVNPHAPEVLRGEREVAPGQKITWAGDIVGQVPGADKFSSSHYPSDAGKNQLFFLRGALHEYAVGAKLPDGTTATKMRRVFEVWEVQSDWASTDKAKREGLAKDRGTEFEAENQKDVDATTHPLISLYEPFAMRTAIIEARKLNAEMDAKAGITEPTPLDMGVSDAHSAMMTEGHDKVSRGGTKVWKDHNGQDAGYTVQKMDGSYIMHKDSYGDEVPTIFKTEPEAQKALDSLQPSQSPGMTAAYDQRLPDTMAKLTGDKGKVGVMGEVHQGARVDQVDVNRAVQATGDGKYYVNTPEGPKYFDDDVKAAEFAQTLIQPKGSPVFRNILGKFKTESEAQEFAKPERLKQVEKELDQLAPTWKDEDAALPTGDRITELFQEQLKLEQQEGNKFVEKNTETGLWEVKESKATNTARIFSLDKVNAGLAANDTLSIKEAVSRHEQAQMREAKARENLTAPLDDAVKIAELVPPEKQATIAEALARGVTPEQALESARLQVHTPLVNEAQMTQNVAKAEVERIVNEQAFDKTIKPKEAQERGIARVEEYSVSAELQAKQVLALLQEYSTRGSHRKNISLLLTREIGRWNGVDLVALRGKFNSIAEGLDVASRGEGKPKPEGVKGPTPVGRVNMTEAEALATLKQLKLSSDWEVVGAGKGLFKVQEKVTGTQFESLLSEEVVSKKVLGEGVPQQTEMGREKGVQGHVADDGSPDISSLPDESKQALRRTLEQAGESLGEFATEAGVDRGTASQMLQRAKVISDADALGNYVKADEALEAADMEPFKNKKEFEALQRSLAMGLHGFRRKFSNQNLGHIAPHDEVLVREMGYERGVRGPMEWLLRQPLEFEGQEHIQVLVEDLLRVSPEALDPVFTYPGHAEHDGTTNTYFDMDSNIRARINMGALPSDRAGAYQEALNSAHEFTHHVTRELANRNDPAAIAFRKTLAELRARLKKALPKEVQRMIEHTEKNGLYDRYADQDDSFTYQDMKDEWMRVGGKKAEALIRQHEDVMYGLLTDDELISQVFSSPDMVKFMSDTQMPDLVKKSVLQRFIDSWKTLVGGRETSGSALEVLLKGFDNYLSGGKQAKGYNARTFLRDMLVEKIGVRPEALAGRMNTVEQLFNKGDLGVSIKGYGLEGQKGILPVTNKVGDVHPALEADLTTGKPADVFSSTINLLADELPLHQDLLQRLGEDVYLAQRLHQEIAAGTVPGSIALSGEALRLASANVNAMRRAMGKQANALERWNAQDLLDSNLWEQAVASQLTGGRKMAKGNDTPETQALREKMALVRSEGKGLNPLRWLQLASSAKDTIPGFKQVYESTRAIWAQAHMRFNQIKFAGLIDQQTGSISEAIRESNQRVQQNDSLSKVTSELMLWQNKNDVVVDLKHAEVKEILKNVNPKDRDAVMQTLKSAQMEKQQEVMEFSSALRDVNTAITARILVAREPGLNPESALQLSSQLYYAVESMNDPMQASTAAGQIQALAQKMSPDTFLAVLPHATGLSGKLREVTEKLSAKPWQATEQRLDAWHMRMRGPQGEKFYVSKDTEAELRTLRDRKLKEGYTLTDWLPKSEANKHTSEIDKDVLAAITAFDQFTVSSTDAALASADPMLRAKLMPALQTLADTQRNLAGQNLLPGVTRRFVGGREEIDMLQNQQRFHVRLNNMLRNKQVRAFSDLHMMHPDVANNREVQKYSEQFVENLLTPDNPFFRKMSEATYFWRLAFDIGQSTIESGQSLFTGMHELIKETGYAGDAFSILTKSAKTLLEHKTLKKAVSPEWQYALNRLGLEGLSGKLQWTDVYDPEHETVMNSNYTKQGPVKRAITSTAGAARKFSTTFQAWNQQIGIVTGMEVAKQHGITDMAKAYEFARDMTDKAYFAAGKVQRNVGPWSIKTKAVPQLVSALQTYTVGWFSQMGDAYIKGWGKGGEGLTEIQRSGARKAFAYSLIAQAAAAGALGLPGFGQGLALFSQATGIDAKGWLRKNLASMFDEDQAYGGWATNLAMRGVSSAGLPFDPSSRLSISVPYIGVDAYEGFSLSKLLGAPAQGVTDVIGGAIAAAKGDTRGAIQALPNAVKRVGQIAHGEGDVRSANGSLLYKLSPAERFFQAIGLPASRIGSAKDVSEMVRNANSAAGEKRKALAVEVATMYRRGDIAGAEKRFAEIGAEQPTYDMPGFLQSVAANVEAQTNVQDWRRDLNPAADIGNLRSAVAPDEYGRRQRMQQTQRSLGAYMPPDMSGDMRAMQMDQLLRANPYLPPAALRGQLGMPRVPRPNDQLWPQGFQELFQ